MQNSLHLKKKTGFYKVWNCAYGVHAYVWLCSSIQDCWNITSPPRLLSIQEYIYQNNVDYRYDLLLPISARYFLIIQEGTVNVFLCLCGCLFLYEFYK